MLSLLGPRPRDKIHGQRHHGQHHGPWPGKKDIPPSLQDGMLSDFMGNPAPANGFSQDSEDGRPQQGSNRRQQQQQAAKPGGAESRVFTVSP